MQELYKKCDLNVLKLILKYSNEINQYYLYILKEKQNIINICINSRYDNIFYVSTYIKHIYYDFFKKLNLYTIPYDIKIIKTCDKCNLPIIMKIVIILKYYNYKQRTQTLFKNLCICN